MQRSSLDRARAPASSAGSGSISSGCTARARAAGASSANVTSKIRTQRMQLLRRRKRDLAACRLRCADPQAPVRERERAAPRHPYGPKPDEQYKRLVINPQGDDPVRLCLTQREINLREAQRHQGGLGGCSLARGEIALGWLHDADDLAVVADGEMRGELSVIRTLPGRDVIELNVVASDGVRTRRVYA